MSLKQIVFKMEEEQILSIKHLIRQQYDTFIDSHDANLLALEYDACKELISGFPVLTEVFFITISNKFLFKTLYGHQFIRVITTAFLFLLDVVKQPIILVVPNAAIVEEIYTLIDEMRQSFRAKFHDRSFKHESALVFSYKTCLNIKTSLRIFDVPVKFLSFNFPYFLFRFAKLYFMNTGVLIVTQFRFVQRI